jgi:hypothetical protein
MAVHRPVASLGLKKRRWSAGLAASNAGGKDDPATAFEV